MMENVIASFYVGEKRGHIILIHYFPTRVHKILRNTTTDYCKIILNALCSTVL
jgi:hypothetical protein